MAKTKTTKGTANGSRADVQSLRPAMAELERALTWAAEGTDTLKTPIVPTIQTKGKKTSCVGWFLPDSWSTREGTICHEINFCAEHLNRDPQAIVATAIHEVTHVWCHQMGVKDVSKGGRHNKKFKEYAEILGLECAPPLDSKGYAYTTPTAELEKRITKEFKPDVSALNLFKLASAGRRPTAATKMRKYSCDCTTVRCATDLKAECEACGTAFEQA